MAVTNGYGPPSRRQSQSQSGPAPGHGKSRQQLAGKVNNN